MVAAQPGSLRVPGLRYTPAKECGSETRHLIDIESGAELIVTDRPAAGRSRAPKARQRPVNRGSPHTGFPTR